MGIPSNQQQSNRPKVALILYGFTPMTFLLNIMESFSFFLNPASKWLLQIETKNQWAVVFVTTILQKLIDNLLNFLFAQQHLYNRFLSYNCIPVLSLVYSGWC